MAGARRGQGRSSGGELHLDRGCAPAGWAGGGGTRCGVGVRCSGLPVAGVGVGQGLVAAAAVDGEVAEQVVAVEDQQVVVGVEHDHGLAGVVDAEGDGGAGDLDGAVAVGGGGGDVEGLVGSLVELGPVVIEEQLQLLQGGGGGVPGQPSLRGLVAAFVLAAGLGVVRAGVDGFDAQPDQVLLHQHDRVDPAAGEGQRVVRQQHAGGAVAADRRGQAGPRADGLLPRPAADVEEVAAAVVFSSNTTTT